MIHLVSHAVVKLGLKRIRLQVNCTAASYAEPDLLKLILISSTIRHLAMIDQYNYCSTSMHTRQSPYNR